jgi:hypothetical protein
VCAAHYAALLNTRVAYTLSFMYAPHEHAQHPCHRALSVACPGFLTKLRRIEGSGKVPPRLGLRPQRMSAELTRLAGATDRGQAPFSTSPVTRLSVRVTSGHCAESACLPPADHATLHDKADAL